MKDKYGTEVKVGDVVKAVWLDYKTGVSINGYTGEVQKDMTVKVETPYDTFFRRLEPNSQEFEFEVVSSVGEPKPEPEPEPELDPKIQECLDRVKQQNKALAAKGTVILTVELSSEEEAEELYTWLYCDEKPMKSLLCSIAWNQALVPKKVADALETMKEALLLP